MSQIISNLPIWVFAIFFGLIYLGYSQSKTRKVSKVRITVLPAIMLSLSVYGVLHAPNSVGIAFLTWAAGLLLAAVVNSALPHGAGVVSHDDKGYYVVPGSWVPLILLMFVFIAKFTLGFLIGSHAVNPNDVGFIAISSGVSGLISGTFLVRAVQIFRAGASNSASSVSTSVAGRA